MRDTGVAAKLLGAQGFRFVQAPLAIARPRLRKPPANYGEILLADGFHEAATLGGRVQAWLDLFELARPDTVVLDHAPTALLAARIAGLPRVVFGNGFFIPPAQSPFPNFRAGEDVAESRLIKSEGLALATLNTVCRAHRQAPFHAVHELFDGAAQALVTLPELDHYGARQADYLGPIYDRLGGTRVDWPEGAGRRVLAYLRPDVPGFGAMVEILGQRTEPTLLIAPNAPEAWVAQRESRHLSIQTAPIRIEPLLEGCDLGISYGGSGTLSQFALAGVPQLVLPRNIEQYLGGMRVQQMGAGLVVESERDEQALTRLLERAIDDPALVQASRAFARRYANTSTYFSIPSLRHCSASTPRSSPTA